MNSKQLLTRQTYPNETITQYVNIILRNQTENSQIFMKSVYQFKSYVLGENTLKAELQEAIKQIPQTVPSIDFSQGTRPGILHGKCLDDLFECLNLAVQAPPSFLPSDYMGTPFSVFLIDLMNTPLGTSFFARQSVNAHIKAMLDEYGAMLRTEKSLKYFHEGQLGLMNEQMLSLVDYDEFVCDRSQPNFGFGSWNHWFTRQFLPEARPVAGVGDPSVIVHAAENHPLTTLTIPATNVQAADQFWLKQNRYSLYDMLAAKEQGLQALVDDVFVGGTIYQGYLSPWCYHQWHAPVSGIIQTSYLIPGTYFLQNPSLDFADANNFDNSQVFLSCMATRHVFIINTLHAALGRVAVVEVGMTEVSSCIATVKEGDRVEKGQCIGRFQLGGSSHVIIFERKAKLQFNPSIFERETVKGFTKSTRQLVNSFLAKLINEVQ